MKLLFTKSKWEMWDAPLEEFLKRAAEDGFDAVEIFLPALKESSDEIQSALTRYGLQLVAQIISEGQTPEEHIASMKERIDFASQTAPLFINSHTGRDIYSFEDNCRIFQAADQHASSCGLTLVHETHRGRPTYNAIDTARYLQAMPNLKLTADFSHWFCVHESDLSDQPERMKLAIAHAHHIHARVGFEEGPQVPDPLVSQWISTTEKFIALWRQILLERKAGGSEYLTICPEFGPPGYMPCDPQSNRPLADAWTVNVDFMKYLRANL